MKETLKVVKQGPRTTRTTRKVAGCIGLVLLLLCGCASTSSEPSRHFAFRQDTFAYANDLVWEYRHDPVTGQMTHEKREPAPAYALHCFVVARAAREFYYHARFDPALPMAEEESYRRLVRKVISRSARRPSPETEKVVIPGYANLYAFSQAHEGLLKGECGGVWQCYVQRGNWRMIFPFPERQQAKTAQRLLESVRENRPAIVHLVRFPSLSINHAMVLFDAAENGAGIEFIAYDPNEPDAPSRLIYDRAERRFTFPSSRYYSGGRVDVYEIYSNCLY